MLWPEEPRGLFTNFTTLPEHLSRLGYSTHAGLYTDAHITDHTYMTAVGKWHLGFCNSSYLPTRRGFDTFYGYYTGSQDYYQHTRVSSTAPRTKAGMATNQSKSLLSPDCNNFF